MTSEAAVARERRIPITLWVFLLGFGAYSLVPFLPLVTGLHGNPLALFVVAGALNLMMGRLRRSYWATVVLAFLTLWYPIVTSSSWLTAPGHRPLGQVLFVFVVPAALICLLLSKSVRDLVRERPSEDGEPLEAGSRNY